MRSTLLFLDSGAPFPTAPGLSDVGGPVSSTDNALVRWDGTTGKVVQNSGTTLSDAGQITTTFGVVPVVLKQDATQHNHTGNTDETTLATYTVPANAMGPNGSIRVSSTWSCNNDASGKTAKIYFGGTGGTAFLNSGDLASDVIGSDVRWVSNRNATNSQIYSFSQTFGGSGTSTGAVQTSAIDTTATVDIVFRGTLADGNDNIALERYIIEVFYGA